MARTDTRIGGLRSGCHGLVVSPNNRRGSGHVGNGCRDALVRPQLARHQAPARRWTRHGGSTSTDQDPSTWVRLATGLVRFFEIIATSFVSRPRQTNHHLNIVLQATAVEQTVTTFDIRSPTSNVNPNHKSTSSATATLRASPAPEDNINATTAQHQRRHDVAASPGDGDHDGYTASLSLLNQRLEDQPAGLAPSALYSMRVGRFLRMRST